MTDQEKKSMQQEVLKAIESGKIKMLPKWRFVLNTVLMALGVVVTAIILAYATSFIVFVLRQNGAWEAEGLGPAGARAFVGALPWLLILVVAVIIVVLEILIRRYRFAYGRPLAYSALGVVFFGLVVGIAVGYSPLHERLEAGAPGLGPLYDRFDHPPGNVEIGNITQDTNFGYMLKDLRGQDITVYVDSQTQIPPGPKLLVGTPAVVLGDCNNEVVHAVAIRQLNGLPPSPPPDRDHDAD